MVLPKTDCLSGNPDYCKYMYKQLLFRNLYKIPNNGCYAHTHLYAIRIQEARPLYDMEEHISQTVLWNIMTSMELSPKHYKHCQNVLSMSPL